ncbi:MAG: endonuclease dU [Candidatus Methanomethylicaceae archaeon]
METVLAVEGGSFRKGVDRRAPAAFLLTDGIRPKRLVIKWVEVDGLDATERLREAIREMGVKDGIVMAGSVPIAGFNLLDPRVILREFGIPTIYVLAEKPDREAVRSALMKHFEDWERRMDIIDGAGEAFEMEIPECGKIFLEVVGIERERAARILEGMTIFGKLPEPLRLARMVARALSRAIRT